MSGRCSGVADVLSACEAETRRSCVTDDGVRGEDDKLTEPEVGLDPHVRCAVQHADTRAGLKLAGIRKKEQEGGEDVEE